MVLPRSTRCTEDNPLANTRGFSPHTGGQAWFYHGLPACTEDNPLAKTRGLSPCLGGQAWFYHGLSGCTEDNPLAKTRELSPRTGVVIPRFFRLCGR